MLQLEQITEMYGNSCGTRRNETLSFYIHTSINSQKFVLKCLVDVIIVLVASLGFLSKFG